MLFGPTGMAVDPIILPAAPSKHTHAAPKRRSDPFSDHSSIQASNLGEKTELESIEEKHVTSSTSNNQTETAKKLDFKAAEHIDDMNTEASLWVMPARCDSYQLAQFLRTTGPEDTLPDKSKKHKRSTTVPRSFRLFGAKDIRSSGSSKGGGRMQKSKTTNQLLPRQEDLPKSVEVKISKSGVKYYQIAEPSKTDVELDKAPRLSADIIIDPNVAVLFEKSIEDWNAITEDEENNHDEAQRERTASGQTVRIITDEDSTPIRPSATPPPSPKQSSGHDHGPGPSKPASTKSTSNRFLDSCPNPLHSHPRSPITALPPVPPVSPTLSKKHSRRLYAMRSPRSVSHNVPNTSRRIVLPHRRVGSEGSVSPGPPPPRSPLRMTRATGSIDGTMASMSSGERVSPVSPISPQDQIPEATSTTDTTLKTVPYSSLPASPSSNGKVESSHSSGSSEAAIATGRRWVVHSKASGREVPVVDVQGSPSAGPSPRQRKVLRRARPASKGKGADQRDGSISKRMSVLQSWDDIDMIGRYMAQEEEMHFPSNPIVRPLLSSAPTQSTLIPATKGKVNNRAPSEKSAGTNTLGKSKPKSPVAPSRHPRPRSAKMPKRHSRQLAISPSISSPVKGNAIGNNSTRPQTPITERNGLARAKDISTISPMTIDPSLPSPPPKRGLPPTPDQKIFAKGHIRNLSGHSATSASVYSTTLSPKKKVKGPKPLNIEKVVNKFPSPPTSARSPGQFIIPSPTKPGSALPTPSSHVARQFSLKVPTSKFSTAVTGKERAQLFGDTAPATGSTNTSRPDTSNGQAPESALLSVMMARMDGIERHNRFLEAALMGILRTPDVASSSNQDTLLHLLQQTLTSPSLQPHPQNGSPNLIPSPSHSGASSRVFATALSSENRRPPPPNSDATNHGPDSHSHSSDETDQEVREEDATFRRLTAIGHPAFSNPSFSHPGTQDVTAWSQPPVRSTPSPPLVHEVTDGDILRARQETADMLLGVGRRGAGRQGSEGSEGSGRGGGSRASKESLGSVGTGRSKGSVGSGRSRASQRSALDTYMRARGMMDTSLINFD
ncbi:hypothetical protein BDZ85DRAFT_314794 [Elsinoe ampelina]|uniref:Uncharacterized protein n=1 Tax=Elsinoe ampelina TaxID=302913 RepID=A0A6A6GN59_9PEZI|nr:hypothetical protein BDZ85DRAFT_314794 [Elsinoe ampelina]